MSDAYVGGEPLAEVVRSDFVESRHLGSVAVLGADGEAVSWAGDITGAIFPRSSNKPLQAVGLLRHGLAVTGADLALVAASHRGQPEHVARVRAMLATGGLTEAALGCPADHPLSDDARDAVLRAGGGRSPVLMNCSGKHAGMLLTCLRNGWPVVDYLAAEHPVQRAADDAVVELSGETGQRLGVDGCGAPVRAMSLHALAGAFLRLVSAAPGSPERAVADAMRAFPEQVSGTDADAVDTHLMRGVPGLLAKSGAEGVLAVAVPDVGAVAVKMDDGALRGRLPVLTVALRRLGVSAPVLDGYAELPVLGGGVPVGAVRSVW